MFCFAANCVHGQDPMLFNDAETLISCARNAQTIGLDNLAEKFLREALELQNISEQDKNRITSSMADIYILRGDWQNAQKIMCDVDKNTADTIVELRLAAIAYIENSTHECERILINIDEKLVNKSDLPLYYTLCGLVSLKSGGIEIASKYFKMSEYACTNNSLQAAQLKIFELREMLKLDGSVETNKKILQKIEQIITTDGFKNTPNEIAKEYTIALIRTGQIDKARNILNEKISYIPAYDTETILSFNLYLALTAGLGSQDFFKYINEIFAKSTDDSKKNIALHFLISQTTAIDGKKNLLTFINKLQTYENNSPYFLKQVLLAKIKLAIDINDSNLAQQTAEEILNQFPGDSDKSEILELLAYLSFTKEPRELRAVTEYFSKLKETSTDQQKKAIYSMKLADAYFLNTDFKIASQLYGELLNNTFLPPGQLILKQVQADINDKNIALAEQHLEFFDKNFQDFSDNRWQTEFNLLQEILDSNARDAAEKRLTNIIEAHKDNMPPLFKIKFYLMQAECMFDEKNFTNVIKITEKIQEIFAHPGKSQEFAQIVSKALFLQGKSELKLQNISKAADSFLKLRNEFPDSVFAKISYFDEAKYYSDNENHQNAINILTTFTNKYGDDELASAAMFNTAICMKNIGFMKYDEAIKILEQLVTKDTKSPIVYQARLEQANVLRLMGKFGSAQLIYEILMNDFPNDKRYFLAQFYRAKCLIAQHNNDETLLQKSLLELEKLYNSNAIDETFRTEVGIEYCLAAKLADDNYLMQRIAVEVLTKNFFAKKDKEFSQNEIFWLKQLLFILKKSATDSLDAAQKENFNKIIESIETIRF